MKKIFALILFLFFGLKSIQAQNYTKEATIEKAKKTGFHKILLSPEMNAAATENFSNTRLFDDKNKEVPFLLTQEAQTQRNVAFNEYKIILKEQTNGCCTKLILHNTRSENISNISLKIKNAEVSKKAKLTGSDDGEHWFALKENFYLQQINNPNATSEVKIVDFPLSNYAFYAIEIDDSASAPLNILSAGYYEYHNEAGKYQEIKAVSILQNDTLKETHILIDFGAEVLIDRIRFSFADMPFYLREAQLLIQREVKSKDNKIFLVYSELQPLQLNSATANTFDIPTTKGRNFKLIINNRDNPPLQALSVTGFQLNRYLTAWFQEGNNYSLRFGPIEMPMPDYDIGFYKDSIPGNAPFLSTSDLRQIPAIAPVLEVASGTFFTSKIFIWAAVIGVISLLGVLSVKMLKETGGRS